MTHDGNAGSGAAWSPDSKRLAVGLSQARGKSGVEEITVASAKASLLTKEAVGGVDDWSPDGNTILCRDNQAKSLALLSLTEGFKLKTVVTTPYLQAAFRFSPDGKYGVYSSNEGGGLPDIYVASFPSFSQKKRVSESGGLAPKWSRNGKEIFYRSGDGSLIAVEVHTGSEIVLGERKPLFKFGTSALTGFSPSADGQRFLIVEPAQSAGQQPTELTLVVNWLAEVEQALSAGKRD